MFFLALFGWPSRARYFCVTTWFDCEQFAKSSPHFPSFHGFTWPNCFRQTRSTAWRKILWSCKRADCRLKSVAWTLWCCWQVGACQNTSCLLRYIWSHYQLESMQVHFVHQLCLTKKQPLIFRGGKPFMWFSKRNNFRMIFLHHGWQTWRFGAQMWAPDGDGCGQGRSTCVIFV